ncbi:MAG: hypothetical protein KGQ16_00945 [Cyanobacteria bacterium REEB444]|nr:hypothetical protein [Cyanobacteria bacterium REEB444]
MATLQPWEIQQRIQTLQKEIEAFRQQRLQMESIYADIIAKGGPDLRPKGPDVPVLERQKELDYWLNYSNQSKSETEQGTATDKPVNTVQPQAIQNEPAAPPTSYSSIQAVGPVEPAKEEDYIYDTSGNTYEQAYQKYLQQIEDNKAISASLQKDVDDARAVYLGGLKDPAEIRFAYDKLQSAIKASSDYASSFLKSPLTAPRKEDFTNIKSYAPTSTTSPESVKNLSIVKDQAASGSEEAQAFLNQYKETSLNNAPQETKTLIASSDTPQKPSGPSTPVKYDPVMKQYVPNVEPGKVLLEILKQAKTGPRGEAVAQSQFGPRGEDIAQILPTGPRGMDRPPGTYHPSNIMPLQTPGSKWRPGEGWMIQNPFDRSPQTGPGLSQNQEEETKPEFDKQRALVASKAADEYRRSSQSEDPFRTSAFG